MHPNHDFKYKNKFKNTFLLKKVGKLGVPVPVAQVSIVFGWHNPEVEFWKIVYAVGQNITLFSIASLHSKWKQESNMHLCCYICFLYFANSTINTSILLGLILRTQFYT
uniref:Uncharacterized protein n=1 Tax=Micrurus spixii TaxID=129469 RepID=A0A2D4N4H4_9SAUR